MVKIEGTVEKIIPLVDYLGYEIKDQTGSIFVIAVGDNTQPNPKIGDRITVEGLLKKQEIKIDNQVSYELYLEKVTDKSTENSEESATEKTTETENK